MKRLAGLLVLLALAMPALAATVYIDPTCASPGDGSSQTCSGSTAPLASGSSITWTAGNTYAWRCNTTDRVASHLTVGGTPSSGSPIVLTSYQGPGDASGCKAIITRAAVLGNWTGPDANGEYYANGTYANPKLLVIESGRRLAGMMAVFAGSLITCTAATDVITSGAFSTTALLRAVVTGDALTTYTTGAATQCGGLSNNTTYYAIKVTDTTFKLATSPANAQAGTAVDITSDCTGVSCYIYQVKSPDPAVGSLCPTPCATGAWGWDGVNRRLYVHPSLDHINFWNYEVVNGSDYTIDVNAKSYVQITNLDVYGSTDTFPVIYLHGGGDHITLGPNLSVHTGVRGAQADGVNNVTWNNTQIYDVAWSAAGGMGLATVEDDMVMNGSSYVHDVCQLSTDYGDCQGFVSNPNSHRMIVTRSLFRRVGRQIIEDVPQGWPDTSASIVVDSSANMEIYRNEIDQCFRWCIAITDGTAAVSGTRIYANKITNMNGGRPFYGYSTAAFMVIAGNSAWAVDDTVIANNLVLDGDYTMSHAASSTFGSAVLFEWSARVGAAGITNLSFKNNTISGVTGKIIDRHNTNATSVTPALDSNNNIYYGSGITGISQTDEPSATTTSWDASHLLCAGAGCWKTDKSMDGRSYQADPQMMNAASDTPYRLLAGSPGRFAGVFVGPFNDYGGRRFKDPPSIGIYEVTSGDPAGTRTRATVARTRASVARTRTSSRADR